MSQLRIIIADSNDASRNTLKGMLLSSGHLIYEARDGGSAVRLSRSLMPDLVLIDMSITGMNAYEVAHIIDSDNVAPVILITHTIQRGFIEEVRNYSVFAYLIKPIDRSMLLRLVEFVVENYKKYSALKNEIENLKKQIEARKKIERAKGLLMKVKKMEENEAYTLMRKMSMDSTLPMETIAERILRKYS
ncbi:ANTAR domain-containing protein [Thermoanaerobacterium sp. RBIITD]|uniref:ANTAR domain-containing response regulator n=1 Tax=Thermoanaerobacterium sp. RBIITD TaxID=1550240 RepID=UPI000BB86C08|nr:ANTAR domain-containing protein [Thermoanaerobacterium sp. RBIITD]